MDGVFGVTFNDITKYSIGVSISRFIHSDTTQVGEDVTDFRFDLRVECREVVVKVNLICLLKMNS